ncbi:hypothetical protein E2C01_005779 [Portunus trituberculatus]|uniref:Uncharacterized protein n=1 Tax=Portunus trituberculatus TaxID=210409 RepID=A0A5B7CUB3_PORTR|nr:hypothetical protein [Portunus trituberculatus]
MSHSTPLLNSQESHQEKNYKDFVMDDDCSSCDLRPPRPPHQPSLTGSVLSSTLYYSLITFLTKLLALSTPTLMIPCPFRDDQPARKSTDQAGTPQNA